MAKASVGTVHRRDSSRLPFLLTQTIYTSLILSMAVSGNFLAWLLYNNPQSELLWRLSVPVNRAAEPITSFVDKTFGNQPTVSVLLVLAAMLVPIASYVHRTWLIAMVLGQTAAGVLATMTINLADMELRQVATASLLDINPELVSERMLGFGTMAAVMMLLCCINHLFFVFAILRRSRKP